MLRAKNNVAFTFCYGFNKCVADMLLDSAIERKYLIWNLALCSEASQLGDWVGILPTKRSEIHSFRNIYSKQ